jgi:hypothetical protein
MLHDIDWLWLAVVSAMLVCMQMAVGCSVLSDAHEKRQAVIQVINTQAAVMTAWKVAIETSGDVPAWPETWPVTILVSEKKGEADTTFIRLPSITSVVTGGFSE